MSNLEQHLLQKRANNVLKQQAQSDFELRFLLQELRELISDVDDHYVRGQLLSLIKRGESKLTG